VRRGGGEHDNYGGWIAPGFLCHLGSAFNVVNQVSRGVGYVPASLCEANGKRPSPPGGQVNTHTQGIAMGMSPAPTISNLYVSIFKEKHIL
jgi:hypothetical protein